ncbi:hypothetical protein RSAG8_11936, partial [Rhizoctonia solani AG-8 WAC10335]
MFHIIHTFIKKFGATRMFGAAVLISDDDLVRVSRCTPVPSIEQLRRYLIKWIYVDTLLESMWTSLEGAGFTVLNVVEREDALVAAPSEPAPGLQVATKPTTSSQMRRSNPRPLPLNIPASNTPRNPHSIHPATAPSAVNHTPSQSTQSSHPPPTPSFPPPKRRYIEAASGSAPFSLLPRSLALLRTFMVGARQTPVARDEQPALSPSVVRSHSQQLGRTGTSTNILQPAPIPASRQRILLDGLDTCDREHPVPMVAPPRLLPPRSFVTDPRSQITQLLDLRSILLSN